MKKNVPLFILAMLGVVLFSLQIVWAQEQAEPTGRLFQHYFQESQEQAEPEAEALPEAPPSNPLVGEFFQRMLGGEENATGEAAAEEPVTEEAATEEAATEEAATEEAAAEEATAEEAAAEENATQEAVQEVAPEEATTEEATVEEVPPTEVPPVEAAQSPQQALEEDILQLVDALRLFGTPQYAELAVEPNLARISGITLTLADMTQSTITIDEIVLSDYAYLGDILQAAHMNITGMHIPLTEEYFGEAAPDLHKMGYTEMVMDLSLTFHYEEAQLAFVLDEFSLAMRDIGSLALSFTLGGVDLARAMESSPDAMSVVHAELRYEDASFIPKFLEMTAAEEGMTLEQLREAALQELDMEIERVRAEGDEFTAVAYEELKKFLVAPNVLRLSIAPEQPVSFASLGNIEGTDDAVTILNMVVVAE